MAETHLLVFAGAGLTKALEGTVARAPKVPLMADFVARMADHVDDDVILGVLVALQKAHAFRYAVPAADALANRLRTAGAEPDDRRCFAAIMQSRPSENIEDLLQRLEDLRAWECRATFGHAIAQVFATAEASLDLSPLRDFVRTLMGQAYATRTFVSFNYDLTLDQALYDEPATRWHPNDGYGGPIQNWLSIHELQELLTSRVSHQNVVPDTCQPRSFPAREDASRAALIKPHGSLNWLGILAQNVMFAEPFENMPAGPVVLCDAGGRPGYLRLVPGVLNYPSVELPDGQCAQTGVLLLPPGGKSDRFAFRQRLLERERDAVRRATHLYVIGWSMPKTDVDQRALIRDNVAQRQRPIERLVVVNYGAGPDYYRDVADTFGVDLQRVEVFNDGFREYVKRLGPNSGSHPAA